MSANSGNHVNPTPADPAAQPQPNPTPDDDTREYRPSISRSFMTRWPTDRIWDVLNMPRKITTIEMCSASDEEVQYLLSICRCTFAREPAPQFGDLFPRKARRQYQDDSDYRGRTLLEQSRLWYRQNLNGLMLNEAFTDDPLGTASDDDLTELYLRLYAIPFFAAWLADCFSSTLFYAREAEAKQHAEAEAFVQEVHDAFAASGTAAPAEDDCKGTANAAYEGAVPQASAEGTESPADEFAEAVTLLRDTASAFAQNAGDKAKKALGHLRSGAHLVLGKLYDITEDK